MKIGLDFAFTIAGGMAPILREMVRHLSEVDPHNKYILLVTDQGHSITKAYLEQPNVECKVFPKLKHSLSRLLWEQFTLPSLVKREKLDVLFCPNNRGSLRRLACKKVILLGTMAPFSEDFLKHYGLFQRIRHRVLARIIIAALNKADMTIFESAYTKKLIESKYGFKGPSIVNHHCKPTLDRNAYTREFIAAVRKKFNLINDYFLYVTYVREYKNIERLIEAYALARPSFKNSIDCVIAGPVPTSAGKNFFAKLKALCKQHGVENEFKFLGHVDNRTDLAPLTLGCLGYLFPSIFENWSAALVEALTYGLPIVTTTSTAMPETCGEASLCFDPEDTITLKDHLISLANNPDLRKSLSEKSLQRAAQINDAREDIRFNRDLFARLIECP